MNSMSPLTRAMPPRFGSGSKNTEQGASNPVLTKNPFKNPEICDPLMKGQGLALLTHSARSYVKSSDWNPKRIYEWLITKLNPNAKAENFQNIETSYTLTKNLLEQIAPPGQSINLETVLREQNSQASFKPEEFFALKQEIVFTKNYALAKLLAKYGAQIPTSKEVLKQAQKAFDTAIKTVSTLESASEQNLVQLIRSTPGLKLDKCLNNLGDTPLHVAVKMENPDVAQALLKAGANPNAKNAKNNTPLHVAVIEKNRDLIQALLQTPGVDKSPRNITDETPLGLARNAGSDNIVSLLKSLGSTEEIEDSRIFLTTTTF